MSAGLEWPSSARLPPEARAEISAEHHRRERAAAARRAASMPEPALARRLAAAERRIAELESFNREILPDAIGQAMADLHEMLDTKASPATIRTLVGEAMASLHRGTWTATQGYREGVFVTHSGSLWLSTAGNVGVRPGDGSVWRLVAKGVVTPPRRKGDRS
jgi:hypothetical protein